LEFPCRSVQFETALLEDPGHPLPDRIQNAIFLDRVVSVLQFLTDAFEDVVDRPLPIGALEGVLVLVMFFGETEFEDSFHKVGRGQGTYPIKEHGLTLRC